METPAALENLLVWLGQNAEGGARAYLDVRQRLVALFQFRGCADPEELADQTLDRTAAAILKAGFAFAGNPMAYLRGVARNVHLESLRKRRPESLDLVQEPKATSRSPQAAGVESLFHCLDECLAQLGEDKRAMLLRYYQGEKSGKIDARAELAREKGIELNALRIQVFRLRNIVRLCVEQCADSDEIARLV